MPKLVVITGANSGIGKAAAIKFAKDGHTVIMACRNVGRSRKAQQEIMAVSGNKNVDLMEVDMSSFESIKRFCSGYGKKYGRLDVLINNAGYFNHGEKQYQRSADQLELTFATNLFGPYLMTKLLRDLLAKSDDPRVLNACSTNIKHFFEPTRKIGFANILGEMKDGTSYDVYRMYGDSKMALLMMTLKMAREYLNDGIKVNAVMISAVRMSKETIQKFKSFWRPAARLQNLLIPLPDKMAANYVAICTAEDFKNVTGKLVNKNLGVMKPGNKDAGFGLQVKQLLGSGYYPAYAEDREIQEQIWSLCNRLA